MTSKSKHRWLCSPLLHCLTNPHPLFSRSEGQAEPWPFSPIAMTLNSLLTCLPLSGVVCALTTIKGTEWRIHGCLSSCPLSLEQLPVLTLSSPCILCQRIYHVANCACFNPLAALTRNFLKKETASFEFLFLELLQY